MSISPEMAELICRVDLSTPEKVAEFKKWQNDDGTIDSLRALLGLLVHCPNCPDQGWYAVGSNEDGWEQVPCEFCYTVKNSYFNAQEKAARHSLAEKEAGSK